MRISRTPPAGIIVLVGRAVAQTGLFAFLVGPALVLSDPTYNELIVGVTIMLLAVVAPVGAFQQHLIRLESATSNVADARRKSVVLAVGCAAVALAIAQLFTGIGVTTLLLAAGSILSVVPTLVASLHAIGEDFTRSALTDACSGVLFLVATVPLLVLSAGVVWWAAAYCIVWVCATMLANLGPLRPRQSAAGGTSTPFGSFASVLVDARTMIAIGVVAMAFNRADYLVLSVVGTESEAARYALATRVVGPMLIALGSLNNSLYVRQIRLRDDPAALLGLTRRASHRVGALAVVAAPLAIGVVALMGVASDAFARRSLVAPTALLSLAIIPYAFAIPYGFALNATSRERWWLLIIAAATVLDATAVAIIGSRGAIATALLWIGTQALVFGAVSVVWRWVDGARLRTEAHAR